MSQWDSPHAGSRYNPPNGEPWAADDIRPGPNETPAIKHWTQMVRCWQRDTGFSRDQVVDMLKRLPEGRRVFEKAAAEAASL
jgi:hypothetical protein